MKLNLNSIVLVAFFLLTITSNAFASKEPIKFGKVSKEELEMSIYSKDSSAPAVILCDYGYWNLRGYMFTKVIRIKILKKEGLEYGNQVYPSDEGTTIRGKTFNLVNGEIQVDKLKGESIFKERIYEDYYNYRIAMPNVKVGSVIDIEITHFGIPTIWHFQQNIPIKWSELIIPQSMYIDYRKNFFGHEQLYYSSNEHWIAKDMPAFKPEAFISSSKNFITKFEFDVLAYRFPGYYKEFTTDWDAVARRLKESSYFGGVLNIALYLSNAAKEIEKQDSTPMGRMKLAYQTAKHVKWNEQKSFLTTYSSLGMSYKEGVGNSADINMILVNLLHKLDIEAHPVVLSTRDNGLLPRFSPSINKLNYVIAYAKIDNIEYLMDATEENSTVGILPLRCLNGMGHVMMDNHSIQVVLSPTKKEQVTEMFNLKLSDDLVLRGNVSSIYRDYGAYNFRNYFKSFNSQDDMVEDMEENHQGITISNYQLTDIENIDLPVMESYEMEIKNQLYTLENKIYLSPLLHLKKTDNPFKEAERKYPVSFGFCSEKKYIFQYTLPEGYQITELPKSLKMMLPDNGGSAIFSFQSNGNNITVLYQFTLNKTDYSVEEYQYLRELYNQIINKQSEAIILSKNE